MNVGNVGGSLGKTIGDLHSLPFKLVHPCLHKRLVQPTRSCLSCQHGWSFRQGHHLISSKTPDRTSVPKFQDERTNMNQSVIILAPHQLSAGSCEPIVKRGENRTLRPPRVAAARRGPETHVLGGRGWDQSRSCGDIDSEMTRLAKCTTAHTAHQQFIAKSDRQAERSMRPENEAFAQQASDIRLP